MGRYEVREHDFIAAFSVFDTEKQAWPVMRHGIVLPHHRSGKEREDVDRVCAILNEREDADRGDV